ncbi:hypothetical protein BGZ93_006868 [Podila epicladia]|nr:hypothetical protein BGZ92_010828 [Podila epicladia]KAG0094712.1 hypothetical protein BGZ93_006868 [Podila epicladia]
MSSDLDSLFVHSDVPTTTPGDDASVNVPDDALILSSTSSSPTPVFRPGNLDSSAASIDSAKLVFSPYDAYNASCSGYSAFPSPDEKSRLMDQLYNVLLNGNRIDLLSKLPYEIATYILHFVDMNSLVKVALISRTWNQFARDNEIWKAVFLYQNQWRIRQPSPKRTLPLNWKMLCHDRKELEHRWKSVPPNTILPGHKDSVYCIQFDTSKIVTGSRDRTIKFWDLHTLKCTHTLKGHSQSVLCLQFDEKIMVSGSSDNTIIVWDMETHQPTARLHGHTAGVLDVCFDDQYIISCSKDATIKVWDIHTKVLLKTMMGHHGPVNAVQLHKGQVVSASGDGLVKLWNVSTGLCVRDFIGHERGLACVQFDGETIVSGSNDKTIRVWEASTGKCLKVLTGHDNLVRTLHFDQNRIISGSYDHTVKVWDMKTGECTLDLKKGHVSWVFDVQFSASKIVSTSQDRNILVWDFGTDLDTRLFI